MPTTVSTPADLAAVKTIATNALTAAQAAQLSADEVRELVNALTARVAALESGTPPEEPEVPEEPEEPEVPETPTTINILGASVPQVPSSPDGSVELGLRFSSSVAGNIVGIRFYKGAGNTGIHVGSIWSAAGTRLAQVIFVNESAEGWQTALLTSPLAVTAGTQYVVSYSAPNGGYSVTPPAFPITSGPLTATQGVYEYPAGGFPDGTHDSANYSVDVVFAAGASVPEVPEEPTTPPTNPDTTILNLPRIPWEGGPAYWDKFAKAKAAGWTNPAFFPISVFFGKPSHVDSLKNMGINVYQGIEHEVGLLKSVTDKGVFVLEQGEFSPTETANNPGVVGWHAGDEPDMGYGVSGSNDTQWLAEWKSRISNLRAKNDGRFIQGNFGNGILGTWWSQTTFDDFMASVDVASVDKYGYTSTHVQAITQDSDAWPTGVNPKRAAYYGWLADRMRAYQSSPGVHPNWVFVESAKPYLTESDATTITPEQMAGAEWSAIIHEARGIAVFQHNNDPQFGNYSLVDIPETRKAPIRANHQKIHSLAPVINTQSYVWNFNAGVDTMLKSKDGFAYIFAIPGLKSTTGSKTFTLPAGVTGASVEVVGENRTLPVQGGKFTDTFAQEYSHHVYKVAL